jgi:DNA repair protein RadC
MTPMIQWPAHERPRERLLSGGGEGMTEAELLALVLGTSSRGSGGVLETSRDLLSRFDGLAGLARCRPGELTRVPGIGEARACAVVAVMELARRLRGRQLRRGDPIACADDAYQRVKPRLAMLSQEVFLVLALDARHRVLSMGQVAKGSATSVEVHPREVFAVLVREGAAAGIVAHNHPSGDPRHSEQDRCLTRRLSQAGELMGIPLLDHIIVGDRGYVSMAEKGLL